MKKKPQQSVTSLPPSPDEERHGRMLKYSIAMAVRLVCVVLAFVFPEWWRWLFVAGAIILPYVAVVIANTASVSGAATVVSPGGLVSTTPPRNDTE
jgi:predicted tellurium resistance membrane protein TerC